MARANPVSKWGALATLARKKHVPKAIIDYPLGMDVLVAKNNVHANFQYRVSATSTFCYKITGM